MMWDYFIRLSKKKSFLPFIYPADLFERRAQEEIVRSDECKNFFVYAEINFKMIEQCISEEDDQKLFISVLSQCLQSDIRGSDAIGELPDKEGIVLLMPETKESAWNRLKKSFREKLPDRKDLCSIFDKKIHPIVYPPYLDTVSGVSENP